MRHPVHSAKSIWDRACRREMFALLLVFAITILISPSVQGQTHSPARGNFTGGSDGAIPDAGRTLKIERATFMAQPVAAEVAIAAAVASCTS